jgi:[protein-PII] uridylyltransferase
MEYDAQLARHTERQLADDLNTQMRAPDLPLQLPVKGRLSRLARAFPLTPRVDLRADDQGRYYILSIVANDRYGLLYTIAYWLAQYRINVHTARINTLGERAEDTFLLDGAALSDSQQQLRFETELLRALAV